MYKSSWLCADWNLRSDVFRASAGIPVSGWRMAPVHVDHINGVKTDNRWLNLRMVTPSENTKNAARSKANKSGITGVMWMPRYKKWKSYISSQKKVMALGMHEDFYEAVCTRKSAEVKYGFHENHGRSAAEFT